MGTPEIPIEEAELRLAYETAQDVCKTLEANISFSPEKRLIFDLSTIVLEAIDCIDMGTRIEQHSFDRINTYASNESMSPLLRLGFSLTVLLEKLLWERYDFISVAHNNQASSSYSTDLPGDAVTIVPEGIVKEEPLDEDFIKMEVDDTLKEEIKEEPADALVDVFNPITGQARPVSERNAFEGASNQTLIRLVPIAGNTKETIVVRANRNLQSRPPRKLNQLPVRRAQTGIDAAKPSTGPAAYKRVKICCMCGEETLKYETTPNNHTMRSTFLSKMKTITAKDKKTIEALHKTRETAHFCYKHFNSPALLPVKHRIKCDLCGDPAYPARYSPKDPENKKPFFKSLQNLTPKSHERIRWFLNNPARATVCMKHIIVAPQGRPERFDLVKSTAFLTRKRLMEKKALAKAQKLEIPSTDLRAASQSRAVSDDDGMVKEEDVDKPGPSGKS